jgi:hypothetical protein
VVDLSPRTPDEGPGSKAKGYELGQDGVVPWGRDIMKNWHSQSSYRPAVLDLVARKFGRAASTSPAARYLPPPACSHARGIKLKDRVVNHVDQAAVPSFTSRAPDGLVVDIARHPGKAYELAVGVADRIQNDERTEAGAVLRTRHPSERKRPASLAATSTFCSRRFSWSSGGKNTGNDCR